MREVCVFYAYDDKEFFNREKCLAYEREALMKSKEIYDAYTFFDKNMSLIAAPIESEDMEDWANWFDVVGGKCAYVVRHANLSSETEKFYYDEWGYCILNDDFNNELGIFRYDYDKYKWVKVGEQPTLIFC